MHLRRDGLGGIVVADLEYPPRVAFALLNKLMNDYDKAHRYNTMIHGVLTCLKDVCVFL